MFYAILYRVIYINYDFYYFAFSFNCWYLNHDSDNDKLLNNISINAKQFIA